MIFRNFVFGSFIFLFSFEAFAASGQVTIPGVRVYNQDTDMSYYFQLSSIVNEQVNVILTYYDYVGNVVTEGSVSGDLVTGMFVNNYVEGSVDHTVSFSLPPNGTGQISFRAYQATIDTIGKVVIQWSTEGINDKALMGGYLKQRRDSSGRFSEGHTQMNGGQPF